MTRGASPSTGPWRNMAVLTRYWLKGRLTRATLTWLLLGEGFAVVFIAFGSQTFLAFSSRFGVTNGFSEFALSLILAFILVGLLQSGFTGSGLPVTSADVDYVFTSPVKPRDIFGAKVLINSLTTVLFSFPPLIFLYLRLALFDGTSLWTAFPAGLATLLFLVTGLVLSADVTISLSSGLAPRMKLIRDFLIVAVAAAGIIPVVLLIPGTPAALGPVADLLPSGLTAEISIGLVSGTPWGLRLTIDSLLLATWFAGSLFLGIRMSRGHFYEVLQVMDSDSSPSAGASPGAALQVAGKSVWSVVRGKESVVMRRTKERRGLLVSSAFLSAFMVIYSLAGMFQSSPTSFLFILFIIGSFGSGNASGWLEKERLWVIKTSALDVKRYVREVYLARVAPLLLSLTPVTVAVGVPLVVATIGQANSYAVLLALPSALEVAAVMMGGGMYFAARYGQSTADDILTSQAQQLTDVKRFLYQTLVNLAFVSPLMGFVLLAAEQPSFIPLSPPLLALILFAGSAAYTLAILTRLLNASGGWIDRRDDL